MKTIKKPLLALLIMMASVPAFSQAQVALGVKGGLNFANVDASSASGTYDNRTGYHFGAFGLIKLSKIGIQPEILFSQQGTTVDVNTQDFDANFTYINVPILVKLYTIAGINIQAGPQFGFLSRAEFDDDDVKKSLKDSDFSVAMGLGWDLPFGLTVDARYNLGITDISEDDQIASSIKNQVWQVSVGYKIIKLGK